MVRKIVCLLLIVILCVPSQTAYAKEAERFILVSVEYSDNPGAQEVLKLMSLDGNIYVDAAMLAERLGYQTENTKDYILIYNTNTNEIPIGKTQFFYNSTKVKHMILGEMIDSYEAPFQSLSNDKGSWIPLEYSLLILNSGMMLLDNSILIDIPDKNIMDHCYDLLKNMENYNFVWTRDLGEIKEPEEETDIANQNKGIELFDDALNKEESEWTHLFRTITLESLEYEEYCPEIFASLLCCESRGEFSISLEKVAAGQEVFPMRGQVERVLEEYTVEADSDVEGLYEDYKDFLENIEERNSPAVVYSREYQALKEVADQDIWFSDIGKKSIEVHKSAEENLSIREIGVDIKTAAEFRNEFIGQDEFSYSAVTDYLNSAVHCMALTEDMSRALEKSSDEILRYSKKYSPAYFLIENMEKWYSDSLSDLNAMKKKVMLNMYVRDAFFNMISSRPKRTETADMFEMLLYSQAFQEETSINCRKLLAEAFDNPEKFLAKDWYILSQYCYTYLKSCYRARCIGLGLLERNPQKEEVRWETDKQNCINYEVSKAMVNFKAANKTNRGNVYGFLPADNELYLSEFDNSSLLAWIDKFNIEKVSSILQALPEDFCFSSGMGAWATHFHINTDGTFEGQYHDTNMGEIGDGYPNGTVYICNFRGKFSEPEQIEEYVYSMKLEKIEIEEKSGEISIEEGVRYFFTEPYGFEMADELYIYCPGIRISELEEGFVSWIHAFVDAQKVKNLPYYGIYNVKGKNGFVGYN